MTLRSVRSSSLNQISDINLTPLMDLTFILLITFIITFPLLEQGIPLNLPTSDARPLDDPQSSTITLTGDGALYLADRAVSHPELGQEMLNLHAAHPETTVLIRAEETLAYGEVVVIMKILQDANITRVALVTSAENQ